MKNGQTLVEMIVVVGVVVFMVTGIVAGTITSLHRTTLVRAKTTAAQLAQEGVELTRQKRDEGWRVFQSMGTPQSAYCVGSDAQFAYSALGCSTPNISPEYVREVTLMYEGGSVPPLMEVRVRVAWGDTTDSNNQVTLTTALTDWR